MANPDPDILNWDLLVIPPDMEVADHVKPVLRGLPDTDWNDNQFGRVPIWSFPLLDDQQARILGAQWMANITGGLISKRTVIIGLKLAMSIKSMTQTNPNYLIHPQVRPILATNEMIASKPLPDITDFCDTPFSPALLPESGGSTSRRSGEHYSTAVVDSDRQKADSYRYLAFFLMRLLVKGTANLLAAITTMKTRYGSLYGSSSIVSSFRITPGQSAAYKQALNSEDHISLTFTHALANTHQNHSMNLTPQESGMLSYLGFLPFSYTGMHAYTLMMELKVLTNVPLPRLLALFYCNVMSPAIYKIEKIANNFERTSDHPDRSVLFRYCTHWGAHYFSAVRSKKCAHLCYTVACAWNTVNQGKGNADPENIAATRTLSQDMKKTLKTAGEIIGKSLKARQETPQADEDNDKFNYDDLI